MEIGHLDTHDVPDFQVTNDTNEKIDIDSIVNETTSLPELKKKLIGLSVRHSFLGVGTITKLDRHHLTVKFNERTIRKYALPGAFYDGYLEFVD